MPALALYTTPASPAQQPPIPSPLPPLLQTPHGLAIIEIQGSLNNALTSTSPAHDFSLGHLSFPALGSDSKKVYFYVGKNQRLLGEIKELAKPLAVVRKRRDAGADGDDAPGGDAAAGAGDEDLEIVDIVTHKLFFGSRPEFV